MTSISTWMTKNVVVLKENDSVKEACILMEKNSIGAVVVVDAQQKPIGIFTERDALYKIAAKNKNLDAIRVKEVMTHPVRTAHTTETYNRVYTMMYAYNIRHLPVIDKKGSLAGIVSIRDLMRFNTRVMEKNILDLKKERETLRSLLEKNIDERAQYLYSENERLKELITIDSLTGLFNHKYFRGVLEREVLKSKRYFRPLTLLFIDIDHFKHYNDINGHEEGNKVLMQLAEILKNTSRKMDNAFRLEAMDIVARYGGEEFVILMPETRYNGGMARGKRLLTDVRNFYFFNEEAQPSGKLTISIGVASFPGQAKNSDDLINMADEALYKAKNKGRDRIC